MHLATICFGGGGGNRTRVLTVVDLFHRTFKCSDRFRNRRLAGPLVPAKLIGAGEGTRTRNLRITNPPLYQLSYASLDPIEGL